MCTTFRQYDKGNKELRSFHRGCELPRRNKCTDDVHFYTCETSCKKDYCNDHAGRPKGYHLNPIDVDKIKEEMKKKKQKKKEREEQKKKDDKRRKYKEKMKNERKQTNSVIENDKNIRRNPSNCKSSNCTRVGYGGKRRRHRKNGTSRNSLDQTLLALSICLLSTCYRLISFNY